MFDDIIQELNEIVEEISEMIEFCDKILAELE